MITSIKLTVFFEEAFWVGVLERTYEEKYEVARVVFGAEPKDYEVYEFMKKNLYRLSFKGTSATEEINETKINPKRLQREIKKETESRGVGTKAQLALKLQYEENKLERKKSSKERKEEQKERKFILKQQKKLMKHKGH